MSPKFSLLTLIIITLISACSSGPYSNELTAEKPKTEDIVGFYRLETENISKDGSGNVFKEATIMINDDGTYAVSNIPNLVNDGYKYHRPVSVTGKWTLQTVGHFDNVWGQKLRRWGIHLNHAPEGFDRVGFMGRKAPYKLIVDCDDPTLDKVMIFRKD